MIVKSTKDYSKFKFRKDNRASISSVHVNELKESITRKNMLEFRPIQVNGNYEIMDGQHRLKAAQELGLEIYYTVDDFLAPEDIIMLNVSKGWSLEDYLNFWIHQERRPYIEFKSFCQASKIGLKLGLTICFSIDKNNYRAFKEGNLVFNAPLLENVEKCWDIIAHVRRENTYAQFTHTVRFWRALLWIIGQDNYNHEKMLYNLAKMANHITIRATLKDYKRSLCKVYNYRNTVRIRMDEDEDYD